MAQTLLLFVLAYALAGLVFGLFFVTRGVQRLDAAAAGARWPFRLMILPGVVALWPLLARRWMRAPGAGREAP